jgi:multiple sugar transport system permease protein
VVLLAGLQSIGDDIYEAGVLDGATGWRAFRYLTIPLLRPVLLVAVLLNVIYVFNSFPIIWTLTEGGPANQTHIIVTYLYQAAISQREYGQGYAMAVLTFLVLLGFSLIYIRLHAREGLQGE